MKHKTSELTGPLLDLAVGMALGMTACKDHNQAARHPNEKAAWIDVVYGCRIWIDNFGIAVVEDFQPSTNWAQGGALIEPFELEVKMDYRRHEYKIVHGEWLACAPEFDWEYGKTALIAICRAVVASKFGDEIELPEGI